MITAHTGQEMESLDKKILELAARVGNTPLFRISDRIFSRPGANVYAKKEWMQIGGSVKARAAYSIFRTAIERRLLDRKTILLDATSGNTGIAYAEIGRQLGIHVSLCMPENASLERKEILRSLGVEIIYTSPLDGTDGSQAVARDLAKQHPGKYFYADQYSNDSNWKAHYATTAVEIIEKVPSITHFAAGLGTTGTFVGTGRRLRELNPSVRLIAFQPDSPMHGLEGWKHLDTAVVPSIYDASLADEIIEISTDEAYDMIKKMHREEGLLLSPSSAANIVGAIKVAERAGQGEIVTVLPDNADKYSEVITKLIAI